MNTVTLDKREIAKANAEATEAKEIAIVAQEIHIASDAEFREAGAILVEIKSKHKSLEARRKLITGPLMKAKKEVDALFKNPLASLKTAEGAIKKGLASYHTFKETEKQKLLADANAKADEGASPTEVRDLLVTAAQEALSVPKVEGISLRTVMKFEIMDEDLLPRHLLTPDLKRIRAAIQSGASVPGVRSWEEKSIAAGVGE
mgnify:CR=1 FL=1